MSSVLRSRVAAVAAGSMIIVGLGSFGAVAGGLIGSADIRDGGVKRVDIGSDAVGRAEIVDGSVNETQLSDRVVGKLEAAGVPGPQGEKGEAGGTGADGAPGPQGAKGDTGDQGLQGAKGEAGQQGIQGAKGDTGDKGLQGEQGASPLTAFAVVRADGTVVSQRGVSHVHGEPSAAGGHVYTIGFSDAVGECAVQVSVVDSGPSEFYSQVPIGFATARRTPEGAYPNYLANVAEGYNVRVFDSGGTTGVAKAFTISAMC